MSRFQGLEDFAAVVETGSFTAAADLLGSSKASVSKRIANLEERLGARLFERSTRRVEPTEAGQLYYQRVATLLAEADEAESIVSQHASGLAGQLRVSVPMSYGLRVLAPHLHSFACAHRSLHLDLDYDDDDVNLIGGGYDLAIRIGHLADSELVSMRLGSVRSMTVAAPRYLEERGRPRHPSELSNHECLLYRYLRKRARWEFGGGLSVSVTGHVRTNNGDAIAMACARGVGVAYLPDFIIRDYIESGELVVLFEEFCEDVMPISALYPSARFVPAKTKALLDWLKKGLGT